MLSLKVTQPCHAAVSLHNFPVTAGLVPFARGYPSTLARQNRESCAVPSASPIVSSWRCESAAADPALQQACQITQLWLQLGPEKEKGAQTTGEKFDVCHNIAIMSL